MDFLNSLENNSILLIPYNLRDKVLEYLDSINSIINIKIMTFNDLKKGLMFDYNNEAIYNVMINSNVNYSVAKNYVDNLYFINNKNYSNSKLDNLVSILNDLDNKDLLIKDRLFKNLLKSKSKLYVYGFNHINKFNNYLLDLSKNYIEVINLDNKCFNYKHTVYKLKTIEDEIAYVAEEISKLIDKGIPLSKIFIANYSSDYYFTVKKIFSLFNIPIYIKGETKLSDTSIGKYFINNLTNSIEKLLIDIKKKFDINNNSINEKVFNKLSNLINTYYWTRDYVSIKDLIESEMKTISIPTDHYEEEIVTTTIIDNSFSDDEYVFLIGFNQGSIPSIFKDEDYINDSIKTELMETSVEKNKISKDTYITSIKNIKNLIITCKEVSSSQEYLSSTLVDGVNIIEEKTTINYSNYSDNYNKLLYASKLDNFIMFNEKDDTLNVLHSNYSIPYKSYSNKYELINKDIIRDYLSKNNKKFSYSNISTYYECPFRFYLSNFFYLDKFRNTFPTFIGSLFHKVMEDCITNEELDIDIVYDNFINENKRILDWNSKCDYYVNKLREEVHFIVDNIRKQYEYSTHDKKNEWHEKEIILKSSETDLNVLIDTTIKGIVDKCLVIDNDILVIDYKTGTSAKVDRDLFEYGIDIQLPIYLYLLKNINKEYNIVGMYLQKILQGLIKKDDIKNKSIDDVRLNRLKLDGITLDDTGKISKFDSSYDKSNIIQSLSISNTTGEWSYKNRVITYEDTDKLYNTIKKLIEDCINNVSNSNFEIKPINIIGKVDGCSYCKFKDICYLRESDKNYINTFKNGGDDFE